MDKNSPFQKMASKADRTVTGFPGKQWRDIRSEIKSSKDPVDVSLSEGHPRALHREVDMRVDKAGGESRSGVFNKIMGSLGL